MAAKVYGYSLATRLRQGLDPKRLQATLYIDRADGRPLTRADIRAIEAAYRVGAPKRRPAGRAR